MIAMMIVSGQSTPSQMLLTMNEMEIGVLDRMDMDYFADIFVDLQARGKTQDKDRESTFRAWCKSKTNLAEIDLLDLKLAPWRNPSSPGKLRANCNGDSFAIK